ncbi:AcrR family transcriptional regulator [Parabacteroides sp. PFB2-12]|uniref:TetR/AcrR family transcriptional regulator n=1 Tax=unclassified Parabacteroides TaxID=2649774 RepID=UPI0024755C38|nr:MULTISPECIES: TetR/AcrR family transcriptional regulator [unclassified Parabacteroides]MDH6343856.1 AcrR family transcriptional regulator [Parabacteroides sp. PM6-13]MDH6391218.1 AcrR family transcriptional regulator [Parabacteroides sp. PFB2-12]
MPRTPEQFEKIREEKKKIILDTALELFANQGYAATSIKVIAEKAGISKGLMYNYFDSKETLLRIIMTRLIEEMLNALDPNHDGMLEDDELLHFIDYIFEFFHTRKEEMKLYYQLSLQPEVMQSLQEFHLPQTEHILGMYTHYFSHKFPGNTQLVMIHLMAVIKGFSVQYVFCPEQYPDELLFRFREYLKDLFIRTTDKH